MVKAIGDRLAEALAEFTHKKVREYFSYGLTENLSNDELIKEKYRELDQLLDIRLVPITLKRKFCGIY